MKKFFVFFLLTGFVLFGYESFREFQCDPPRLSIMSGEMVRLNCHFVCEEGWFVTARSVKVLRKHAPEKFFAGRENGSVAALAGTFEPYKGTNRAYDCVTLVKYQNLPLAISQGAIALEFSSTGMSPGDYLIYVQVRAAKGDRALYPSRLFHVNVAGEQQVETSSPLAVNGKDDKVVLPKLFCSGESGSILGAAVPWKSGFRKLITGEKVAAETRVKMFHDGRYIYLGIEAMEPQMDKLVTMPENAQQLKIWRNDSVELNFDPEGRNQRLGKVIIDCNGDYADYYGEDDNTGNERFILTRNWRSRLKVVSHSKLSDRWTLECALPVGVFFRGIRRDSLDFRFNVARNRRAENESSDLYPVPRDTHAYPRFYPAFELDGFCLDEYQWQVENFAVSCSRENGKVLASESARVLQHGKEYRGFQAKVSLISNRGAVLCENSGFFPALPGVLSPVSLNLSPEKLGRHKVLFELFSLRGDLLCSFYQDQLLDWKPISIHLLEPAYRNNIYASMHAFNKVVADVHVSEGLGCTVAVTLSGPGYSKTVTIASSQTVNRVEFPFENQADGEYAMTAGEARITLRKLPRNPGEVWIDKDGVTYVDGKIFQVYGCFGAPADWHPRGVTMTMGGPHAWKDLEIVKTVLDKFAESGVKFTCMPYLMTPEGKNPFSNEERRLGKLTEEQRQLLRQFVAVTKDHPGILGYELGDEPEGLGHNEDWYEDAQRFLQEIDPYHPTIMVNYGMEGQRRFHKGCDILCTDCYPDYYQDGTTMLPRRMNYDASKNGSFLRPTWMIIQCFDWGKKNPAGSHSRAPTYDELREQAFSAYLGNAKGLRCYSFNTWGCYSHQLRFGRLALGAEMDALKELLQANTQEFADISPKSVQTPLLAGIKAKNGKLALIAVNTADHPVSATLRSGLELPSSLYVEGEGRSIAVQGGRIIQDSFLPHEVHIYVTEGVERDAVDIPVTRKLIAQADLDRYRPGNLAAGGELSLSQMFDYKKGIIPPGVPQITCSSDRCYHRIGQATQYFLQDGIREVALHDIMAWTPAYEDKEPWLEIDFGKDCTVGRMQFYTVLDENGLSKLNAGRIFVWEKGEYRQIASFTDNVEQCLEMKFDPATGRKFKVVIDKWASANELLHEWEIYEK